MNIGMVTEELPYLPSAGGFRLYGANLIRGLSRRHRVDLISLVQDGDERHLDWARTYCASVRVIPVKTLGRWSAAASLLSAHLWGKPLRQRAEMAHMLKTYADDWDVMHVEGEYVGGLLPPLAFPKILSVHDSWTLKCEEMLKCSQSLKETLYYRMMCWHEPRYERLVYPRFQRVVVVAERDQEAVRKTVPNSRVTVIGNGTDTHYFHPVPVEKDSTMVFHGHLGYAPNVQAACEFVEEVLPLVRREVPDATFHLVGASPHPKIEALARRPGIRLSANLPDLRAAVCSARVYVSPIRHGTGVKNKILEAMAMRLPIVCSPDSIDGIRCVPGTHLMVARTPAECASHILGLLSRPHEADRLAASARTWVEQEYSWESRIHAYEALYEQAINERTSTGDFARGEAVLDLGRTQRESQS